MGIQYAGGTRVNATFTGDKRNSMMSNILSNFVTAGFTNLILGVGQGYGKVGTFTITIAAPGVVTMTGHGFLGGERVILQTTGAIPSGLAVNTVYFVKYIDANTFNLATTLGGANITTTGSQSGVHTLNTESIILQTATTAQALAINFRFKDNLGSCVTISMESTDGIKIGGNSTTNGHYLLPAAAETWRIIACQYQFFIMGPNSTAVNRKFACGGVPYIPSPISVPTYAGWLYSDSIADTNAGLNDSWRKSLCIEQNGVGNSTLLFRINLFENYGNSQNNSYSPSSINLVYPMCANQVRFGGGALTSGQPQLYRWDSDDVIASDALLAWGLTTWGDEPKIRCQMWDAIIILDSFTMDWETSFDSHNWHNLTSSQLGSTFYSRGSLFIVIP